MGKKKRVPRELEITIVGTHHRMVYPLAVSISKLLEETGPHAIRFELEPDNPADENAIKVYIDEGKFANYHIGYLARGVAEVLSEAVRRNAAELGEGYITDLDISMPDQIVGYGFMKLKTNVLPFIDST